MQSKINQIRKLKGRKPILMAIVLIILLGIMLWNGLEFNRQYNNPSIIGKWISQETGKEVEFTGNGSVNVDKKETGAYMIKSPNILMYDVQGHTFEMNYKIEHRSLVWGLAGEEEIFERKGL